MNSKAFAIFVGAIMVLSAFASFVLMGVDENQIQVEPADSYSLQNFQATGNLVDWNFDGLQDVLEMAPESTVMAYWINLSAPANLTGAAAASLPQSLGMIYGSQMYSTRIERLANINFNGSWTEFHWIKPYKVGYSSLVLPYENYMMIPTGNDYVTVLGTPVLFGLQEPVERVIDVITGGMAANGFSLADYSSADLQVAALGRGGESMPLSGAYDQFYLELKAINGSQVNDSQVNGSQERYDLMARLLSPQAGPIQKLKDVAFSNNLSYSSDASGIKISGSVAPESLQSMLTTLLGPLS